MFAEAVRQLRRRGHTRPVTNLIAVQAVASLGLLANMGATVLAQVDDPSNLAPWVSGGGAAAAIGALVYMAKLISDGKLVAVNTADREQKLFELIKDANEREDECIEQREVYRSFLIGRHQ